MTVGTEMIVFGGIVNGKRVNEVILLVRLLLTNESGNSIVHAQVVQGFSFSRSTQSFGHLASGARQLFQCSLSRSVISFSLLTRAPGRVWAVVTSKFSHSENQNIVEPMH